MPENISDDRCKEDDNGGARYCIDCKQVIYMGSRLQKDAYYLDEDKYYHHEVCPEQEEETSTFEEQPGRDSLDDEYPSYEY